MKLLALSTSATRCSVALLDGEALLAGAGHDSPKEAGERLFGLIDQVLAAAGLARTELEAVACDVGPGSFTGTRVGLASAKGIAVGLGIPLVGVSSLEALAAESFSAAAELCEVVAAIDAGRGEMFCSHHRRGEPTPAPRCARLADFEALVADLGAPIAGGSPSAEWIGRLGFRALGSGAMAAVAEVEPIYLRGADAKLPERSPSFRLDRG